MKAKPRQRKLADKTPLHAAWRPTLGTVHAEGSKGSQQPPGTELTSSEIQVSGGQTNMHFEPLR
jgi:hypothetical protein